MDTAVSIWLIATLAGAAGLKLSSMDRSAAALATYGIERARLQRVALLAVIAVELGLAGALAVGASWAAAAAAVLFASFALVTLAALLAGRGGRPCACFGSSARLRWSSPVCAGALAALSATLAFGWLPHAPTSYDRWLTVALAVAIPVVCALVVAVLALAREVGVLRLEMRGRGALEILEEGPELGSVQAWAVGVPHAPEAMLRLVVFTSEGCPLCRRVAPAVSHVAADPLLAVEIFDELAHADVWEQAAVPGSPYAVALDLDGTVLAKGTFNGLAQLESVLGSARARERELAIVS